jgi:methionyl-tRNA synthetase
MNIQQATSTYIFAALPYAYSPLHVGNFVGSFLPADLTKRFLQLKGVSPYFLSGSDCYGEKIAKFGKTKKGCQQLITKIHAENKEILNLYNISLDIFDKTTDIAHLELVREVLTLLRKKKALVRNESVHFFCVDCCFGAPIGNREEGLTENTCAICTKKILIQLKKKVFFFKVRGAKKFLEKTIKTLPPRWVNLFKTYLADLQKRSISRILPWGVPFLKKRHLVVYVWFEALLSYLSFAKTLLLKDAQNKKIFYFFYGKDNFYFHSVLFPAILQKLEFSFLKNIKMVQKPYFFLNNAEKKLSKSENNTWVSLKDLRKTYHVDFLRYRLGSFIPANKDSSITTKLLNIAFSGLRNGPINTNSRLLTLLQNNFRNKKFYLAKYSSKLLKNFSDIFENNIPAAQQFLQEQYRKIDARIEKEKLWFMPQKKKKIFQKLLNYLFSLNNLLQIWCPTIARAYQHFIYGPNFDKHDKKQIIFITDNAFKIPKFN